MQDRAPIVVGVDGTAASQQALVFAIREACLRGSPVEVVTAWTWSSVYEPVATLESSADARDQAQRLQDEAVTEALSAAGVTPVVSRQVVRGDPAQVLIEAARGAAYLVVGSAHKGVLKRAILGSVSEQCVRHADCPVMVIPLHRSTPETTRRSAAVG